MVISFECSKSISADILSHSETQSQFSVWLNAPSVRMILFCLSFVKYHKADLCTIFLMSVKKCLAFLPKVMWISCLHPAICFKNLLHFEIHYSILKPMKTFRDIVSCLKKRRGKLERLFSDVEIQPDQTFLPCGPHRNVLLWQHRHRWRTGAIWENWQRQLFCFRP